MASQNRAYTTTIKLSEEKIMERPQIKKVPEALLHGASVVAGQFAIRAWSQMPGNPNEPAHMAKIHYLHTPEQPEPPLATAA
jgi:hypothetical protein